ncbi:MAG: ABC transporter permease [Alphaproteobacteria bacterium]|nr:ABC transporter permease [Alphaproteobacteria bacterium]
MSHHLPAAHRRRLWILPLLAAGAAVSAVWQPFAPDAIDLAQRHAPMSALHWLGTDHLGRDVLSRVLVGAHVTVAVVAIVGAMAVTLGSLVGLAAALGGRWTAAVLLRGAEFLAVAPSLVIAIALTALFGLDALTAGFALGIGACGPFALLSYGLARRGMAEPYVRAARALGAGTGALIVRHVWPAMLDTQFAYLGAKLGRVAIAYAALAFLGLGADVTRPDWGAMLYEYRPFMFDNPLLMVWPGLAVVLVCVSLRTAFGGDPGARVPASGGDACTAVECAEAHDLAGASPRPLRLVPGLAAAPRRLI